jgi:hypothetical protein
MNLQNSNNSPHHDEIPVIHRHERNTNEERLLQVSDAATAAGNNPIFGMMATPKVSWDEFDGRVFPSSTKKIRLSPPPLLPSNIKNNITDNNIIHHQFLSNDDSDSVLSMPSLDRLDNLQQPVFRLKQRRSVVGGDSTITRWRLRHRTRSDPLDYLIQPHPHPQRRQQRKQQRTSSSSSLAQESQQRQRAMSHVQQQGQQQDEEEDELLELLRWK